MTVTHSDRQAAEELRASLADQSGFWHLPGDDGPLCQALARYRVECEQRLLQKLQPFLRPDEDSLPCDSRVEHGHPLPFEERFVAQV